VSEDEFLQESLAHLDMLYNLARRMTSTREEAEDLVQETYLRALQGWRRKRPDRMSPWLVTICLNNARSRHRRRSARPPEVLAPEPGEDFPSPDDTAAEAIGALDVAAVHGAMAQLPCEQREAIALMDLCGFTAAEAADVLRIPRNTVLSRVHRGHKRLAALLEEVTRLDS
jgi:RNA polymerase sigma-70 factor (ECF subfamily)